jgi:hypothetical protein
MLQFNWSEIGSEVPSSECSEGTANVCVPSWNNLFRVRITCSEKLFFSEPLEFGSGKKISRNLKKRYFQSEQANNIDRKR